MSEVSLFVRIASLVIVKLSAALLMFVCRALHEHYREVAWPALTQRTS